MCQWVAAEDAPEMVQLLDAEMHSVEHIIKVEQVHRVHMGCSLTNEAPSNGEGGRTREGTEEAQQFKGQTTGPY